VKYEEIVKAINEILAQYELEAYVVLLFLLTR
jgi:hypothetical protein